MDGVIWSTRIQYQIQYKSNFTTMFQFSISLSTFLPAIFTFSASLPLKGTFSC